ncbi:hypothetical protein [Leifsonia shinshuensis]|uniref:UPF0716 family protein affecting phage T7 exclusion n=1 Tax=Leifsonia shinshuensis TaxID=150026 RepID=A0A853CY49_9MICO|nr:UPF0716 family protein affecting phage T7 exclusion [Leifsonia shinshuensis]
MGVSGELVPLGAFLLLAALFAVFGGYLLRRPERAAALFADRDARETFRPRDARAIGLVFTLGGLALLAVGAVRLVVTLTAG